MNIVVLYAFGSALCFFLTFYFIFLANRREPKISEQRNSIAKKYGFSTNPADRTLMRYWRRGPLFKMNPDNIINIASGIYKNEQTVVCDIRGKFTLVAVHRNVASAVVIDVRREHQSIPHEEDSEFVGVVGDRVLFSNNESVARRITDRRFLAFVKDISPAIQVIWSEGSWSLATLPLDSTVNEVDLAIEQTHRFSDLMKVLPPRRNKKRSAALSV